MRKEFASVFMAMAIGLVACGGTPQVETTAVAAVTKAPVTEPTTIEPETINASTAVVETTALTAETSLSGLEKYLLDENVLSGNRTEMAADMVGATSGVKYSDSHVELYEYDTNSDAYKKLSSGEKLGLKGMDGFFVSANAVNGKYILIITDGETVNQDLLDAFESYK